MFKKLIAGSIIVIVAVVGGYVAHSFVAPNHEAVEQATASSRSIEDIQAERGKPVKVETVTQRDLEISQTFYGTVTPYAEAKVQGKYGGKLTFLKGKEGDSVTQGEVIVKFDKIDTQLQLQQAIAAKNTAIQGVNQAKSNYDTTQMNVSRYQELFKDGFIAKQQLDDVQNQLQSAQANLNSAGEQVKNAEAQIKLLNNTVKDLQIKAPINGIIDEKLFNLNEIPGASDVIYHIVALDQVYIEVEIPESYISQLQEQMTVHIAFDSLQGREFNGDIERIIPTGNAQSRNFIAKVLVENVDHALKPGMFARVNVCLERIPGALVMNKKALLKEGDDYYVFKVVETQAQKIAVEVKHRKNNTVAVASNDLHDQDQVVIEGVRMLQPNDRINIL